MLGLELRSDYFAAVILLIILLSLFLFYGAAVRTFGVASRRRRGYWRRSEPFAGGAGSPVLDVGEQLRAVMAGTFQKQRILNLSEYRVFKIVEDELAAIRTGHRVFAQTCLGEVLQTGDDAAFHAINAKRVDILIVDKGGWPTLAIEYQGEGHYQGTAVARDAMKKEALRKAGVGYVEITAADSDAQIRLRIRELLGVTGSEKRGSFGTRAPSALGSAR